MTPTGPTPEQLDTTAQHYVNGLAERDSRPPEDAARAPGARTDTEIAELAARIAADRQTAPDVGGPLDPASLRGIEAARALTELLADVDERLHRENTQHADRRVPA